MKFFADEALDVPLVKALRNKGFEVIHALETIRGADDLAVLNSAVENKAVLLTKDKDFGEMVVRNSARCEGVVLIRIEDLSVQSNIEYVVELLSLHIEQLQNHFTVIQQDKIRIRKIE